MVRPFGRSTVTTRYTATEGQPELVVETGADWHEQQKLLKLSFPLDLKADQASSEIQFGHIDRPTHQNTSWDFARFETSAHRWVHVAEPGFGVAIANDSTYGHDVTRRTRADGGTTTQVRESLVRGPKFPDPGADQGHHVFRTVLRVGASVLDAADSGYRLNLPVRAVPGDTVVEPLVTVSSPQVFVEAVKLAEDRSGDVVVRLYEALGGRATDVGVDFGFAVAGVTRVDLLERPLDDGAGTPRAVGRRDARGPDHAALRARHPAGPAGVDVGSTRDRGVGRGSGCTRPAPLVRGVRRPVATPTPLLGGADAPGIAFQTAQAGSPAGRQSVFRRSPLIRAPGVHTATTEIMRPSSTIALCLSLSVRCLPWRRPRSSAES
ncbi:glycoside hydrolase family 38 C-terminal domain-containing protein [Curtobacterium sp. MCPF17_052]|uniref:glycoside hydrolase family 38 C-terminal domain-containing protein n=1 Tax=Curtobacterium sp. MCPF17_052 TaxID=2175655 RepID=UPI0024E01A94|nr:glycoside hydrolase family 38 C-terminal domain-containing protein [Curtobacterium sp. MCPF17_052]WIB13624.1 glycoside hydrolase family 38 C-terminal domain-containing protein [Curtobacterium sp. MCPF17_052]